MKLAIKEFPREEILRRVARFQDLTGSDSGLPDMKIPGCYRTLINVIGFQEPPDSSIVSPVGKDASAAPAIAISEGFNLGFVKAKPGNGPLMHNHDTNETFMPITGRWRCEWSEENPEFVDLGPLDVISFPPGVARRFMNVTSGEDDKEHLMLFVIAGNAPAAEFTPNATKIMESASNS